MKISSNKITDSNKNSSQNKQLNLEKKESQVQDSISSKISSKDNSSLLNKNKIQNAEFNHILNTENTGRSMILRRSYGMIVSGFENVAKQHELSSEAAEQFGKTVSVRIRELNDNSIKTIKDLPEYKIFKLEDINDLGDKISDSIQDPEEYLKGFALLKNPKFASLMESTESVHRSFAESMKNNGEETLLFGMLKMIKDLGGLVGLQESKQINQNNSTINIKV